MHGARAVNYLGFGVPKSTPQYGNKVRIFAGTSVDRATTMCTECGWPLDAVTGSPIKVESAGEPKFKHYLCPSLSERRKLRQAALEQGPS